jgi:CheY-like chemotaxis protein
VILIAEDDDGHARLIEKNLYRAGLKNEIVRFSDGQETLDFLFMRGEGRRRLPGTAYLLFLDIRMPKVDGVEVLRQIKGDAELRKLPVAMLTTTEDPREIARCHDIGCNSYVVKPVDYEHFVEVIRQYGLYIALVRVPVLTASTNG